MLSIRMKAASLTYLFLPNRNLQIQIQDGLGVVLVRTFSRVNIPVRFFIPLGTLLASFWVNLTLFVSQLGFS